MLPSWVGGGEGVSEQGTQLRCPRLASLGRVGGSWCLLSSKASNSPRLAKGVCGGGVKRGPLLMNSPQPGGGRWSDQRLSDPTPAAQHWDC